MTVINTYSKRCLLQFLLVSQTTALAQHQSSQEEVASWVDASTTAEITWAITLRGLFFSHDTISGIRLRGYTLMDEVPPPSSLGAANALYLLADQPLSTEPATITWLRRPLESSWLDTAPRDDGLRFLIQSQEFRDALELANEFFEGGKPLPSPLEKLLLQRDVAQICHCVIQRLGQPNVYTVEEAAVVNSLASLWKKLWLSCDEFEHVRQLLHESVDDRRFTQYPDWSLGTDYLPRIIGMDDASWHELSLSREANRHFRLHHGRSCVRVYVRIPGWQREEIEQYWMSLYSAYGRRLHATPCVTPLPAGTETILIRTVSVVLEDGRWYDSGWPEEVLIRAFKYATPKLDLTTSDWRGTLQYQYKLDPDRRLDYSGDLALCRIYEDDPQFVGFYSEAPDSYHSGGRPVTTMRFNCINCHSTVLYGPATVFSLEYRPPVNVSEYRSDSGRHQSNGIPCEAVSKEFFLLMELINDERA